MTSPRVAALAALLLASPALADKPLPDAADYARNFEAFRLKAKAAYLAPSPIDEAVTLADLKKLGPPPPYREPAERAKKNAELVEALQAVKSLQGAPDQPPLAPAIKSRLMDLVHQRLGLSNGELSKAVGHYQPQVATPAPFAKEPPPSVVAAAKQRELEAQKRAAAVMRGGAVLREDRSAAGSFNGVGGTAQSGFAGQTLRAPPQNMTASDFKPRYKSGPASEVPVVAGNAHGEAQGEHKPGIWTKVVHAANTPLPGTAGWKDTYAKFADRRMAESERLAHEGSALLEKGGVGNTLKAGWNATKGFGNRLVAGDKTAVMAVAIGAAAVTTAIVAAPAVAAAGVVMGGLKVGVLAFTAFSMVNATSAIVKEPDYANAAGVAVNFLGAGYAGKVAHKVGHLSEKVVHAVASRTGKIVVAEAAGTGGVVVAEGVLAGGARASQLAGTARVVTEKAAHVGVEVGHEYTKETVAHSFKPHGPPAMASTVGGPFATSLPGGGKPR